MNYNFDYVIGSLRSDDFFEQYWEQNPLVISRKNPDYYCDLLSEQDLYTLLWSTKPAWGSVQLANHNRQEGWVDYTTQVPNVDCIARAYGQGDTIVVNDLQWRWKPIALVCRSFEVIFNFVVNANLYLTPKGSQGLAPHFDTQNVFILQLQGSKHWRLYDSSIKCPLDDVAQEVSRIDTGEPLLSATLQAGDLLYIPRGMVHEAVTSDDSSMHLTIGVSVLCWKTLLESMLQLASEEEAQFRQALPIGFANRSDLLVSLHSRIEALLKRLQETVSVEGAVERLAERLMDTMQPLPNDRCFQTPEVDTLSLDTVVKKPEGMFCRMFRDRDSVRLQVPGGSAVKGPKPLEGAFRFVADSDRFAIKEMPNSLSENAKIVLARRLINEGLLIVVSSNNQLTCQEPSPIISDLG